MNKDIGTKQFLVNAYWVPTLYQALFCMNIYFISCLNKSIGNIIISFFKDEEKKKKDEETRAQEG